VSESVRLVFDRVLRQSRNIYDSLDNFADVPVEILCSIIEKLSVDDLNSLSLVLPPPPRHPPPKLIKHCLILLCRFLLNGEGLLFTQAYGSAIALSVSFSCYT